MPKINNTSQQAAEAVANKIAGKASTASIAVSSSTNPAASSNTQVPGLATLTLDQLPGSMPQFQPNQYHISDPINPPSMPQATQAQLDKGLAVYEGAQRALKLTGAAFDTTREKFGVMGKQAKAFGAGIQAASEFEKVKGNYLDYLAAVQSTEQKAIKLDVATTATTTETEIAVHSKEEIAQKLIQAGLKAEKAVLDTQHKQGALNSFKQQLGEYLPGK